MQWSDSRDSIDGYIGGSIPPLVKWHMHTSLSRGEHTQTDRAFKLIKECVWVALAVGCMGRVGGGGGGGGGGQSLLLVTMAPQFQHAGLFPEYMYGLYLGHLSL